MIIAFVNHKGGVGKTTSALNIGAGLYRLGKTVLLVDADAQANLTTCVGLSDEEYPTLYDVMHERCTVSEAIIRRPNEMDILPGTLDLCSIEIELFNTMEREKILRKALDTIRDEYDYILIDCPPTLDLCTKGALVAADEVFIPVSAEYLPLKGLSKILDIINMIQKKLINPTLRVSGVLITQYAKNQVICRDTAARLHEMFPGLVFKTYIRENVALKEFPARGMDIFRYAPHSIAAKDYGDVVMEILNREFIEEVA